MEIPKDVVKGFLRNNWVEMIVREAAKPDFLQLVITPRSGRGSHGSQEPFEGLTDFILSWLDDSSVIACTDVCVVENRKYVTLKLENSTGASEESQ